MTLERQEMLRAAIIALDEERTTIQLDPNDVIALLRRVEELERTVAFADRKREQDIERIKALMREVDETDAKWVKATGCSTPEQARERMREMDEELNAHEQTRGS